MKKIINIVNRPGEHCVSSALRDIYEFNGREFNEEFIFGLDGNMGFNFWYMKDKRYRLLNIGGKRTLFEGDIFEYTKVRYLVFDTKKITEKEWAEIKKFINDDIPVLIQTDMFYLDYFENHQRHFPGHACIIVGYSDEENLVYIIERKGKVKRDENGICRLSIDNLLNAIQNSRWFVCLNKIKEEDIPSAIRDSVSCLVEYYEDAIFNDGIFDKFIKELVRHISEIVYNTDLTMKQKCKILRKQFLVISSSIEDVGTGGGLFRSMYSVFLEEVHNIYFKSSNIYAASKYFFQSSVLWTQIAVMLRKKAFDIVEENIISSTFIDELCEKLVVCGNMERSAVMELKKWLEEKSE